MYSAYVRQNMPSLVLLHNTGEKCAVSLYLRFRIGMTSVNHITRTGEWHLYGYLIKNSKFTYFTVVKTNGMSATTVWIIPEDKLAGCGIKHFCSEKSLSYKKENGEI